MRCHICDYNLPRPEWNEEAKEWEPCDICIKASRDTLELNEEESHYE